MSHEVSQSVQSTEPARTTRRAADLLIRTLVDSGVKVVFGIPGGAIAAVYDALLDEPRIRSIVTRHESGAMFAAAAYARETGHVGVVLVTSGPGAINAMTGLASAHLDGLPVLLIAGDVARTVQTKNALQNGSAAFLNIVGMADHISKKALSVGEPHALVPTVRGAIETALSGRRGPVMLNIPLDVTTTMVDSGPVSMPLPADVTLDDAPIRQAAAVLQRASHPVLYVGSGTRWRRGPQALLHVAEALQIPVITTPKAKGVFPENHPLSLGVFGYGGHPSAIDYVGQGVDVLLALGTGMGELATNGWNPALAASRHFIQVDIDPARIGMGYPVSCGIVAPVDTFLEHLSAVLPEKAAAKRTFGVRTHQDPATVRHGDAGLIAPQRALWELQQVLPPDTAYTCDIGEHLIFATHYLRIAAPGAFHSMSGLGSMGSSVASAVGSKLAQPRRQLVAICGDGSFVMCIGDVATAVKENVDIVIVVLNDKRYGMVEIGSAAMFGRTPPYLCEELDIAAMARSVGAHATVIEHADEILRWGKNPIPAGVSVLDVHIDKSVRILNQRFTQLKTAVMQGAVPQKSSGGD